MLNAVKFFRSLYNFKYGKSFVVFYVTASTSEPHLERKMKIIEESAVSFRWRK